MNDTRNQKESLDTSEYIQIMERLLYVVQELSAARDLDTVMDKGYTIPE